mgnify:FL=1
MKWIKDSILDIIIFLVIIGYSITSNEIIEIALWVYTILLLVGKVSYFFVGFLQSKAQKTNVPKWFYHSIYISSIILLILSKNYYLSIAWSIVWILSFVPSFIENNKAVK